MISNRNLCHFFSLWLVLFFMSCNNKYDNIKEGQIIFTKGKESGGEVWVPRTKYRIFIINKIIDSLVLLNEIEPFYFSLYEKNNPIKEPWGDDQKKLFEILRKNIDTITITRFSHDDFWENPLDKENSEYYDYYIDHKFIKKHPQMLYSTLHYVDFTQKEKDTMNLLEYDTYFIAQKDDIKNGTLHFYSYESDPYDDQKKVLTGPHGDTKKILDIKTKTKKWKSYE